jgi:hypothetical protein
MSSFSHNDDNGIQVGSDVKGLEVGDWVIPAKAASPLGTYDTKHNYYLHEASYIYVYINE